MIIIFKISSIVFKRNVNILFINLILYKLLLWNYLLSVKLIIFLLKNLAIYTKDPY